MLFCLAAAPVADPMEASPSSGPTFSQLFRDCDSDDGAADLVLHSDQSPGLPGPSAAAAPSPPVASAPNPQLELPAPVAPVAADGLVVTVEPAAAAAGIVNAEPAAALYNTDAILDRLNACINLLPVDIGNAALADISFAMFISKTPGATEANRCRAVKAIRSLDELLLSSQAAEVSKAALAFNTTHAELSAYLDDSHLEQQAALESAERRLRNLFTLVCDLQLKIQNAR